MIAEIVRYYKDEIDWEKMFQYARGLNFENVLRVILRLSQELLGVPIDERYCEIKGVKSRMLYKLVCSIVLRGTDIHISKKVFLVFLRDDFFGACKVLMRRLFPSKGEIVSRYRLPAGSKRTLLYYFLNPILVLSRKHQQL